MPRIDAPSRRHAELELTLGSEASAISRGCYIPAISVGVVGPDAGEARRAHAGRPRAARAAVVHAGGSRRARSPSRRLVDVTACAATRRQKKERSHARSTKSRVQDRPNLAGVARLLVDGAEPGSARRITSKSDEGPLREPSHGRPRCSDARALLGLRERRGATDGPQGDVEVPACRASAQAVRGVPGDRVLVDGDAVRADVHRVAVG